MNAGDRVVCHASRGYSLTTGKVYVVVDYQPSDRTEWFTWAEALCEELYPEPQEAA